MHDSYLATEKPPVTPRVGSAALRFFMARLNSIKQSAARQSPWNKSQPPQRRKRRATTLPSSLQPPDYEHDDLDMDAYDDEMSSATSLNTSFRISDTIRLLRRRKWGLGDLQYLLLACYVVAMLYVTPASPLIKIGAAAGGLLLLAMPITSQFFFPAITIWVWLMLFFCSRYIPTAIRPPISVRVLPALEHTLFGVNVSRVLSSVQHPVLDIMAWVPYGISHFALPFVLSALIFLFAPPRSLPVWARAFGWLGIIGVSIQIFFPTTPPWYETEHGLDTPAVYGMPGSPAGLARVDALLGLDMYTTSFSTAPVPFGAFPSLHAGNAVLEALFIGRCFPRLRLPAALYACWVCWATMYLRHHYAVDLVGGAIIATVVFLIARRWMPLAQPGKNTRWQYQYVEIGQRVPDEERGEYQSSSMMLHERTRDRSADSSDGGWSRSSSSSSLSSRSTGRTRPYGSENLRPE